MDGDGFPFKRFDPGVEPDKLIPDIVELIAREEKRVRRKDQSCC